jgi:hypothetical protein
MMHGADNVKLKKFNYIIFYLNKNM